MWIFAYADSNRFRFLSMNHRLTPTCCCLESPGLWSNHFKGINISNFTVQYYGTVIFQNERGCSPAFTRGWITVRGWMAHYNQSFFNIFETFANFIRSHANHKQLHCALQRLLSPRNKNANKRRLWSLYRTFIYSEQMAIRCSHCKHTTVQSLQHTRTPTHTDFTQSIAEQHMTHSLKHSHTVAAEQRRHHSGVCSDKHRRKIK